MPSPLRVKEKERAKRTRRKREEKTAGQLAPLTALPPATLSPKGLVETPKARARVKERNSAGSTTPKRVAEMVPHAPSSMLSRQR